MGVVDALVDPANGLGVLLPGKLTVHKVVVGGTKLPSDFQMTINLVPVDQDIAIPTLANTSIEVSELADPAYVKTGVVCTDVDGAQLPHPLVLNEAQSATCTVTNASQPATITLHKDVTNLFGGTLVAGDFHLTIGGGGRPARRQRVVCRRL